MNSVQEFSAGSTSCDSAQVVANYFSNANIDIQGHTDNHVYFMNGVYELQINQRSVWSFATTNSRTLPTFTSSSRRLNKDTFTQSTVAHEAIRPSFVHREGNLVYYYNLMNRVQQQYTGFVFGGGFQYQETRQGNAPALQVSQSDAVRIFDLNSRTFSAGPATNSLIGRSLGGVYKGNLYMIGGAHRASYLTYPSASISGLTVVHESENTNLYVSLLTI